MGDVAAGGKSHHDVGGHSARDKVDSPRLPAAPCAPDAGDAEVEEDAEVEDSEVDEDPEVEVDAEDTENVKDGEDTNDAEDTQGGEDEEDEEVPGGKIPSSGEDGGGRATKEAKIPPRDLPKKAGRKTSKVLAESNVTSISRDDVHHIILTSMTSIEPPSFLP